MAIQSANPPQILTLEQYKGLNQQARRASIDDNELWWSENLFFVAPATMRSMWGPQLVYQTDGPEIRRIFIGFYGEDIISPEGAPNNFQQPPPGRRAWIFKDNGFIDELDLDTMDLHRNIGGRQIWVPIKPKYWADAKVWRPRWVGGTLGEIGGVLFSSPGGDTPGAPGGLWAWDGQNLFGPGDPAPNWLSNADISAAGPAWDGLMPVELPGIYAMEVYMERLWVAGKDVISFSAPDNGADFDDQDGGGTFAYFGDKLVHDWMDLHAVGGFLFLYGDSSVDQVSNVQMSGSGTPGSPFLTAFNHQNVDPQIGHRFPRPIGAYGRYMTLYTGHNIYFQAGADITPIGDKISNLYGTMDFPVDVNSPDNKFYPTMCPATMFGQRVMLFNFMMTDPFGVERSLILIWNGVFWTVASQWYDFSGTAEKSTQLNLTNITSYEDNGTITPYGTDGTYMFRLFDHPDPKLPKRLSTKAYNGATSARLHIKRFSRIFMEIHDNTSYPIFNNWRVLQNSGLPTGVAFTGKFTTRGGGIPGGEHDVAFQLTQGVTYDIIPQPIQAAGISGELDLISYSPDFTIERIHFAVEERTLYGA